MKFSCSLTPLTLLFSPLLVAATNTIDANHPIVQTRATHDDFSTPKEDSLLPPAFGDTIARAVAPHIPQLMIQNNNNTSPISLKRHLAIGDFEELNTLIRNAVIQLPDTSVSERVVFRLELDLYNLRCTQFNIGDIVLSYTKQSNQRLQFVINVLELDLNCFLDYDYDYGLLRGSGSADAYTVGNSASIVADFVSSNFDVEPPLALAVDSCAVTIDISDLDFSGGFVNSILNTFERLIRGAVERAIQSAACDEIQSAADSLGGNLLKFANDWLNPYLTELEVKYSDPLHAENNMVVPDSVKLFHYGDPQTNIGNWIYLLIQAADEYLGQPTNDPNSPTGSDLGINKVMRDFFLNDDRGFSVNVEDLEFVTDGVLYDGSDTLTDTKIYLEQLTIFGLDTFTQFSSLVDVGAYTLQSNFSWSAIDVVAYLKVEVKPSSREDAIIESANGVDIVEQISIDFSVTDINATVSALLAIDENELGGMKLAQLLLTNNLISCLLSSVFQVELTELDVTSENIRVPSLTGFVSPGIDRVVSQAVDALFIMYEQPFYDAMPNMFQTTLRDVLNKDVIKKYMDEPENTKCFDISWPGDWVDFRDMFLPPSSAALAGATGTEPYGDLGVKVMDLIEEQLLAPDDTTGLPGVNKILIDPLTKSQSGVEGMLRFEDTLFEWIKTDINDKVDFFVDKFVLKVSDARVLDVNTAKRPMLIMYPTLGPHNLQNQLNFGSHEGRELTLKTRVMVQLDGEGSPLEMKNEFDLIVKVPDSSMMATIIAKANAVAVSNFPLEDIMDLNCWLATLPAVDLDENGVRLPSNGELGFGLSNFTFDMPTFEIDADCDGCESLGTAILPDLIQLVEQTSVVGLLRDGVQDVIRDAVYGDWLQTILDRMVYDGKRLCPHSPGYNPNNEPSNFGGIGIPALSRKTVETIVMTGAVGAQVGFVVFAERHLRSARVPTNPWSEQVKIPSDENRFVNFANLSESFLGRYAGYAWDGIRTYLGEPITEDGGARQGQPGVRMNQILRDYLFQDSQSYTINFEDQTIDIAGVTLTLHALRFVGLDTARKFDILEPIAPQTLINKISWDNLQIELDVGLLMQSEATESETMTISVGVQDVDVDLSVFIALDEQKFGKMELGSLLFTEQIFACLVRNMEVNELTQIDVAIGRVTVPTIAGFLSPETTTRISNSVRTVFDTYQEELVEAIPIIVDESLRVLLNGALTKYKERQDVVCNTYDASGNGDTTIDFRDLFLFEAQSVASGGKGGEPYGDLLGFLKDLLNTEFLAVDPTTGMSKMNKEIIQPFTESVSGKAGTFVVAEDVLSYETTEMEAFGLDNISIKLFDAQFDHLDTVGSPAIMLEPNSADGRLLGNAIEFGAGPNGVSASVKFQLDVAGDPDLSMNNELQVGVELRNTMVGLSMLAEMTEAGLMMFPVADILNLHCWLYALVSLQLDENGVRKPGDESTLALQYLDLVVDQLKFNIACTSCTSPGLRSLSNVTAILDQSGASAEFERRLVSLATEVLESEFVETSLDRLVYHSGQRCPHSNSFELNYDAPDYGTGNFPALSREAIETVVFAGALTFDIGAVLLALAHEDAVVVADPLSSQNSFQANDGTRLMDFSALGDSIGSWADTAIDEVNGYFNGQQEEIGGPNGDSDLGVNVLLRSLLLNEERAFVVPFEELQVKEVGMEVEVVEARIYGLDSFTEFKAVDPIGSQTLQNTFGWKRVLVELDVRIQAESGTIATGRSLAEPEIVTLSFGVSDISSSISLFLAIDQDAIGQMPAGSLLSVENILPCLLSTAVGVDVTELAVSAGSIDNLQVTGLLSTGASSILSATTDSLMARYGGLLLQSIPAIFGKSVRALANNWMTYYLNLDSSVSCADPTLSSEGKFVDFRDLLLPASDSRALGGSGESPYGDLLRRGLDFVNTNLLKINDQGKTDLNELIIVPFTEAQSGVPGTLRFEGDLLDTGADIDIGGLQAKIELKAFNARVENLDTIGQPLSILDPQEGLAHTLENVASFGVGAEPLRFGLTFVIAINDGSDIQMRNELDISLDVTDVSVVLEALVMIAESRFLGFPIRDIQNLDCWLATLPAPLLDSRGVRKSQSSPSAAITHLLMSVARLNLEVNCVSCSSPQFEEWATLLSTESAVDDFTRVGRQVLDYATTLLGGEFVQYQIDRFLVEAPRRCPHRAEFNANAESIQYEDFAKPETKDDAVTFLITLGVVAGVLITLVILTVTAVKCVVGCRNRKWVRSLPDDKVVLLHSLQLTERETERELNTTTGSMFNTPEIPLYVRLLIPIVIIGNIAFFLSGHLSLGATVNVEAVFAGEKVAIDNFFEFSIAQSTLEIYRAGGKELAILIIIFSGVWPYTKQLITLVLWFTPPGWVGVTRRGSILLWLDALAKWSMVDIFVLIISIAAFRVSIQSPNVDFLPDDFYSVDLLVVPLWGLYANMIAQLISQVSSHFIIHYHRNVIHIASAYSREVGNIAKSGTASTENASLSFETSSIDKDTQKDRLNVHKFARPHRGEDDKLYVPAGYGFMLPLGCVGLAAAVGAGSWFTSFSLEAFGALGIVIESGQEFKAAVTNHSVFSVVQLLMDQASFLGKTKDFIGLGTLSGLLLLTVIVVPVIQGLYLLREWFIPLTKRQRWRVNIIIESLQAWQYVEVYIIAVLVSAWQLGPTSEFMINTYCESLNATFSLLAYYGIVEPRDAQCFQVQATIEFATYILIIGAIILALMNTFVMKAVRQYERDTSAVKAILEETTTDPKMWEDYDYDAIEDMRDAITPPPVLFTDTFRWCLVREGPVERVRLPKGGKGVVDMEVFGESDSVSSATPPSLPSRRFRGGASVDNDAHPMVNRSGKTVVMVPDTEEFDMPRHSNARCVVDDRDNWA